MALSIARTILQTSLIIAVITMLSGGGQQAAAKSGGQSPPADQPSPTPEMTHKLLRAIPGSEAQHVDNGDGILSAMMEYTFKASGGMQYAIVTNATDSFYDSDNIPTGGGGGTTIQAYDPNEDVIVPKLTGGGGATIQGYDLSEGIIAPKLKAVCQIGASVSKAPLKIAGEVIASPVRELAGSSVCSRPGFKEKVKAYFTGADIPNGLQVFYKAATSWEDTFYFRSKVFDPKIVIVAFTPGMMVAAPDKMYRSGIESVEIPRPNFDEICSSTKKEDIFAAQKAHLLATITGLKSLEVSTQGCVTTGTRKNKPLAGENPGEWQVDSDCSYDWSVNPGWILTGESIVGTTSGHCIYPFIDWPIEVTVNKRSSSDPNKRVFIFSLKLDKPKKSLKVKKFYELKALKAPSEVKRAVVGEAQTPQAANAEIITIGDEPDLGVSRDTAKLVADAAIISKFKALGDEEGVPVPYENVRVTHGYGHDCVIGATDVIIDQTVPRDDSQSFVLEGDILDCWQFKLQVKKGSWQDVKLKKISNTKYSATFDSSATLATMDLVPKLEFGWSRRESLAHAPGSSGPGDECHTAGFETDSGVFGASKDAWIEDIQVVYEASGKAVKDVTCSCEQGDFDHGSLKMSGSLLDVSNEDSFTDRILKVDWSGSEDKVRIACECTANGINGQKISYGKRLYYETFEGDCAHSY